jgi:hypothetical protein
MRRLTADATPQDARGVLRLFVEECSTPDRCRPVVAGLQQAIAGSESWSFTRNAVTVSFDPATHTITAAFAFPDTFDPPEQTMPVPQFLALMTNWMTALGT